MPNVRGAITYERWRVMVVLGVLFTGVGGLSAWSGFDRAEYDQAVRATVLGSHGVPVGDADGDGDVDSEYLVTLRYVTTDGDPVVTTIKFDNLPESRHLEVYYDTRAPSRVRLNSAAYETSAGLALTPVGLVVVAFGLWDRRQVQRNPYSYS